MQARQDSFLSQAVCLDVDKTGLADTESTFDDNRTMVQAQEDVAERLRFLVSSDEKLLVVPVDAEGSAVVGILLESVVFLQTFFLNTQECPQLSKGEMVIKRFALISYGPTLGLQGSGSERRSRQYQTVSVGEVIKKATKEQEASGSR